MRGKVWIMHSSVATWTEWGKVLKIVGGVCQMTRGIQGALRIAGAAYLMIKRVYMVM